eukprot:2294184-Prymnesium_polylepis.2
MPQRLAWGVPASQIEQGIRPATFKNGTHNNDAPHTPWRGRHRADDIAIAREAERRVNRAPSTSRGRLHVRRHRWPPEERLKSSRGAGEAHRHGAQQARVVGEGRLKEVLWPVQPRAHTLEAHRCRARRLCRCARRLCRRARRLCRRAVRGVTRLVLRPRQEKVELHRARCVVGAA